MSHWVKSTVFNNGALDTVPAISLGHDDVTLSWWPGEESVSGKSCLNAEGGEPLVGVGYSAGDKVTGMLIKWLQYVCAAPDRHIRLLLLLGHGMFQLPDGMQ